jgi:hypothetical protein
MEALSHDTRLVEVQPKSWNCNHIQAISQMQPMILIYILLQGKSLDN